MSIFSRSTAFTRVTAIAAQRAIHAAFSWIHNNPKTLIDRQTELVAIPAPPFGEEARSKWIAERFAEIGLINIQTDVLCNVYGYIPATHLPAESTGPVVVLSAHLDTVFPASTPLNP